MGFTVIDFIFLVLIGLFMIRCLFRGFIKEALLLAAIVFGFLGALFFYKNGGQFIRERYMPDTDVIPEIIAFAAIFAIVILASILVKYLLKSSIDKIKLFAGIDKLLGIVFGLFEGLLVVCLVLFLIDVQPLFSSEDVLSESFFANLLLPLIKTFTAGKDSALLIIEGAMQSV